METWPRAVRRASLLTLSPQLLTMNSMTDDQPGPGVRMERSGPTATIWLDNPAKRNAFDPAMLQALAQAAAALASDDAVAVVVLRGAGGRAFSAGADFEAFASDSQAEFADRFNAMEQTLDQAVAALAALPQPLVAAIEGACFGGAVQLALCADIRLANESMRLSIPAGSIGIVYPLDAIERLIKLAGPGVTKLILMTGRLLPAAECLRSGLVELTVADDQFETVLSELCTQLTRPSQAAVRAYKRIVDGFVQDGDCSALQALQGSVNASADTWSRICAVIASRKK
jgi:enoyl-CoA hydratase